MNILSSSATSELEFLKKALEIIEDKYVLASLFNYKDFYHLDNLLIPQ